MSKQNNQITTEKPLETIGIQTVELNILRAQKTIRMWVLKKATKSKSTMATPM
jgi:hypothetical protein